MSCLIALALKPGSWRQKAKRKGLLCGRTGLFGAVAWLALALHFQEVADHLVSTFGEHALGMELHALDRQRAVAETHDDGTAGFAFSVCFWSPGGDGEL